MADNENINETSSSQKEVMINPVDFDPTRVVIHDAQTSSFKIGGADISMTVSKGYYLDDEGNECKLYFSAPPQNCFGPQYQYEMNVQEDDKDPSKAKGVQIQYPMTSLQSITSPTPDEQAFQDMIQGLWDLSLEKGKEEMAKVPLQEEGGDDINPEDYTFIPPVSYSSFLAASASKRWTSALKPAFEHPKDQKAQGKKSFDTTKPKRMYIKLKTSGRGDKMRVLTSFYGPGDKKESPLKYIEQRGIITPCIEWDGIYWGGHGQQPHGASLRFCVVEANFVPLGKGDGGLPKSRMLPKNTAAPSADEIEEDAEEGTFAPIGSGNTPSAALAAVAKSNKAKTTAPKVAPKVTPKGTAKAAPKVAPKVTPKGTAVAPKGKAKAAPKVAPKVAPKGKAVVPKGAAKAAPKPGPVPVEEEEALEDEEEALEEDADVEEEEQ
jgi:hypothetical protein